MGIREWLGLKSSEGRAKAVPIAQFQQLEPRLLLSADLIATEPLVHPGTSCGEHAIFVSLDQKKDAGTQESDPSVILTYLASPDEISAAPAQVSDVLGSAAPQAESPLTSPLAVSLPSVEADVGAIGTPAATLLGQPESAVAMTAKPEELAVPFQEESACLTPVDRLDNISGAASFPIEARGPPVASCDSPSSLSTATWGEDGQPCVLATGGACSLTGPS